MCRLSFLLEFKMCVHFESSNPTLIICPKETFAYVNSETFTEVSIAVLLMNKTPEK